MSVENGLIVGWLPEEFFWKIRHTTHSSCSSNQQIQSADLITDSVIRAAFHYVVPTTCAYISHVRVLPVRH